MSKCTPIRDFCGDYAFDVEYSAENKFTMFFNSRRNAETVKKCIEVDDSVPNAATAVDFVEVVRCKDCAHAVEHKYSPAFYKCNGCSFLRGRLVSSSFWCKCGERSESA